MDAHDIRLAPLITPQADDLDSVMAENAALKVEKSALENRNATLDTRNRAVRCENSELRVQREITRGERNRLQQKVVDEQELESLRGKQ